MPLKWKCVSICSISFGKLKRQAKKIVNLADRKQCECDFVNQAVDGEDEDALFCEGDVSGILADGDKVAICGHGRCEGCEVLEGG